MATLTGANSTLALSFETIYPTPVIIQGFAVDDKFSTEAVSRVETQMGVDGNLSYGFVHTPKKLTLQLMADSESLTVFENVVNYQEAIQEALRVDGSLILTSIGKVFTLTKGVITSDMPFPTVKKMLQPMTFEITFESITPSPL